MIAPSPIGMRSTASQGGMRVIQISPKSSSLVIEDTFLMVITALNLRLKLVKLNNP